MISQEDKEALQNIFANRFKSETKKEKTREMRKEAVIALAFGVIMMIVLGVIVFLPALVKE